MCGHELDGAGVPANDPLWPKGGRPTCRACHAAPVYLNGLCGTCLKAAGQPDPVDPDNLGPVVNPDGTPTATTLAMLTGSTRPDPYSDVVRAKDQAVENGASWAAVDRLQVAAMRAERARLQAMLSRYLARGGKSPAKGLEYAQALLRDDY